MTTAAPVEDTGDPGHPSQPAAAPRCAPEPHSYRRPLAIGVTHIVASVLSTPCVGGEHLGAYEFPPTLPKSCFACSSTQAESVCDPTGRGKTPEDRGKGTGQARPKAPPHSFLPNLQPGRQSAASRRGQVLAGPLTRASTPQSRTQVGSWLMAMQHSACTTNRVMGAAANALLASSW